jgi:AraC-like DNA-binding protein
LLTATRCAKSQRGMSARALELTTEAIAVHERFGFWRDIFGAAFGPLDLRAPQAKPFDGALQYHATASLGAARIRSDVYYVGRTQDMIFRHPGDSFFVLAQIRGAGTTHQSSRVADHCPGDLVLVDGTAPSEIWFDDAIQEQMLVTIPAELLGRHLAMPKAASAIQIGHGEALATIIRSQMRVLASPAVDHLDKEAAALTADHFLALIALGLGRARRAAGSAQRELLLQAALDFVERRLSDPTLAPVDAAEHLSISVRHLHRVFREFGTPFSRWILKRRLERCRKDLGNPALVHLTIAEIAARNGFLDRTHFARTFRLEHGQSARSFRNARRIPR